MVKRRCDGRNFLDFQASHCQCACDIFHRQVNIHELFKPIYGNFHIEILLAELAKKPDIVFEKQA